MDNQKIIEILKDKMSKAKDEDLKQSLKAKITALVGKNTVCK